MERAFDGYWAALKKALVPAVFLMSIVVGWWSQQPPAPEGADAPTTTFSAARARVHVERLAAQPRPIGSAGHAKARAYIEAQLDALGVKARTRSLIAQQGNGLARIHNVVARVEGTAPADARLTIGIMGHYDSVASGPGAGDNAAGVAAMLETIRAIKASPPLPNTIAFVFTDGEEAGLYGAQAIDAGGFDVMLNFDARGSRGVSLLFETGRGNADAVRRFARLDRPVGSSAYVEAYRRMPNDSDFSYFRETPGGLNFVFLDGFLDYHSEQDDVAHLSLASVQHHGDNMLQLARSFGTETACERTNEDLVFFDVLGRFVVRYPTTWSMVLAVLLALAVAATLYAARRWRGLSLVATAKGAVLLVSSGVAGALIADIGWSALQAIDAPHRLPQGHAYDPGFVLVALAALVAAATSTLSIPLRSERDAAELLLGAAVVFAIAGVPVAWMMPGTAYLFEVPGFVTLAAGGLACAKRDRRWDWWAPALIALVGLLYVPAILLLSTALTFRVVEPTGAVVGVLAALAVPHFPHLRRRWLFPAAFATTSAAMLIATTIASELDDHERRANSLAYVWDQDARQATFVSSDASPDEWTRRSLGDHPKRETLAAIFPGVRSTNVLSAPAPEVPTAPVTFRIVEPTADKRELELTIGDGVALVDLRGTRDTRITEVDGKYMEHAQHVTYWAPSPTFTIKTSAQAMPAQIHVHVVRYGLPQGVAPPRPPHLMQPPVGFGLPDMTIVRATGP